MTARDITGEVVNILQCRMGLSTLSCLGVMLDGCTTNLAAARSLELVFSNASVIRCFCHLFNNVGSTLQLPELEAWTAKLQSLLSLSHQVAAEFRQKMGFAPWPTPGHRWGSQLDRNQSLFNHWDKLIELLRGFRSDDQSKKRTVSLLLQALDKSHEVFAVNVKGETFLKLQLALAVDVGLTIVTATRYLEQDSPLVGGEPISNSMNSSQRPSVQKFVAKWPPCSQRQFRCSSCSMLFSDSRVLF